MIQLQFTDDNCPMLVRFLVSTRLHLTLKSEKGRSNLKWYKTLWKTWYDLCVAVGWWSGHCVKSVQMRIFLWSEFSSIWTEYGDLLRKTPYSVWMRENTDQKKLCICTLLTQWVCQEIANANGLFQNKKLRLRGLKIWNFQGYWRNSKQNFQGLIKNVVESLGMIKKISSGISL